MQKLLRDAKIRGQFTSDGVAFISESVMNRLVIEAFDRLGRIDIAGVSSTLQIPAPTISAIVEQMNKRVVNTLAPCRQVKLTDLSRETGLPETFLVALLKRSILEGSLAGSLDMVDSVFLREQIAPDPTVTPTTHREQEIPKGEAPKPSTTWYLVPLFLGLIGGIVGYFAVRDEDRSMANNLLLWGIVTTFLGIIMISMLVRR